MPFAAMLQHQRLTERRRGLLDQTDGVTFSADREHLMAAAAGL